MIFSTFAVIGGDKRMLFAAQALLQRGFKVLLAGFDKLESYGALRLCTAEHALKGADAVILPVTGLKNGSVPVYFSDAEIKFDKSIIKMIGEKPVFCGKTSTLGGKIPNAHDILRLEVFAAANAQPTAEGAVLEAMKAYEGTILGSRCLVIGYGRIGRVLSQMLRALNARVTVATGNGTSMQFIRSDGNAAANTADIKSLSGFDLVFNTADSLIIDKNILDNSDNDTILIDLASLPGGIDIDYAKSSGFTAFRALALPGRYSPKTAGKIISDAVLTVLKEEYSWQKQV